MTHLFDPITGFFNINFWLGGIATNIVGFGLAYLGYATECKTNGRRYFWHGTIALVIVMSGLSVLVSLA